MVRHLWCGGFSFHKLQLAAFDFLGEHRYRQAADPNASGNEPSMRVNVVSTINALRLHTCVLPKKRTQLCDGGLGALLDVNRPGST